MFHRDHCTRHLFRFIPVFDPPSSDSGTAKVTLLVTLTGAAIPTPLLISLFITLSSHCFGAQPPSRFEWAPLFWTTENRSFDPNKIVVEDPSISLLAELPSGHTDLKSYRATNALISDYSLEWKLEGGDTKDYSKAPDCTRAEVHALKLWATNEIYPEVNRALRTMQEGKLEGNPLASKVEREILMIASGINCAPQYRGPVVRMENTPALLLAQYEPGNYLGMRAFTSTTKGTNPSAYFLERNLQEIFIPEASGADIDVLEITAWPEEKEVLIRPGTVFRVTSRTHYPGKKPSHLFFFEQF